MLRATRGAAAQIAALAHIDHAYISRVLAGKKPVSAKILLAIDTVLVGVHSRVSRAILRRAHPEIEGGGE
jgi:hypothetical protein